MSELSKYIDKPSFQKIKILDGRSIGIRKWMLGEEKDFLFNIESSRGIVEDPESGVTEIDVTIEESIKLAKRCVDKPKMIDTMSSDNVIYLLSELRKISKGENIQFTFHCSNKECPDWVEFSKEQQESEGIEGQSRTPFEDVVVLSSEETVLLKRFNNTPIKIGGFKYHIQEISYKKQQEIDDKYISEFRLNEWNYHFVLNSIKAIEPDGEKKITDLPLKELSEFIDSKLDAKQFKELSDKITDQISDFSIKKKVKCPLCGHETDIIYDELFSLMVF